MKVPLLRCVSHVTPEPWKNGGGTTRTLAQEGQAWRVSLANIERDGPYSQFPLYQRISVIVRGAGIVLRSTQGDVALKPGVLVHYNGQTAWQAKLVQGPCVALNVMVKEGVCRASTQPIDISAEIPAQTRAVILANGASLRVNETLNLSAIALQDDDYLVLPPQDLPRQLTLTRGTAQGALPLLILIEMIGCGQLIE